MSSKIYLTVSFTILLASIVLPYPFQNWSLIGFGVLSACCLISSSILGFNICEYLIKRKSDILKANKIEYFYTGATPHVNLSEVLRKLEGQSQLSNKLFSDIRKMKRSQKLGLIAFALFPIHCILFIAVKNWL